MTAARSSRARWACGLVVAAGFFTLPFNGLIVLYGFWVGNLIPLGTGWIEESAAWGAYLLATLLAFTGFGLGWWHRREIEVRQAPPVDAGLARAGELLGAIVGLLALFLLTGTALQRGWI